MPSRFMYAGYPECFVRNSPGGKKIKHLLWGDWIKITADEDSDGWFKVHVRGVDGFIHKNEMQEERLLEMVFVDVGQGDGCLLVTPKDEHLIIDAGEEDNLHRYIKWRYNLLRNKWKFKAAVITHPDQDHYRGFQEIFEDDKVSFDDVYHNGIMEERTENKPLGPTKTSGGNKYLTELIETKADLQTFLADGARWQHPTNSTYNKRYPTLLNTALNSGRVSDIKMLSTGHGIQAGGKTYMPGFAPGAGKELSIQVLGPIPEPDDSGNTRLRMFKKRPDGGGYDVGKTKNGHSVLLLLHYRDLKVFFGGDLNKSSEAFLMQQYSGIHRLPRSAEEERQMIDAVKPHFRADITKSCHHGAADFSDGFLQAVSSAATVVSSGDDESHGHPRADTLGAIGLNGKGWRPLIFSTELARSTKTSELNKLQVEIGAIKEKMRTASPAQKTTLQTKLDETVDTIQKVRITSYGAINLRSDGRRVVMAYMLERPRDGRRWDIYKMEKIGDGPLVYID